MKWLKYFLKFLPIISESYKIAKAQELPHYTNALNELQIMKQKFQLKSYLPEKIKLYFWLGKKKYIQPTMLQLTDFNLAPIQTLTKYLTHKVFT